MQLNLIFLPLLGGYLFYTRCYLTAYAAKVSDGHRLIFHAAAFGLIFCVTARAIVVSSMYLPSLSSDVLVFAACGVICSAIVAVGLMAWAIWKSHRESREWTAGRIAMIALGGGLVTLGLVLPANYLRETGDEVSAYACQLIGGAVALAAFLTVVAKLIETMTSSRIFTIPTYAIQLRLAYLVLIASGMVAILVAYLPDLRGFWPQILPMPLSGTAAVAFLLAVLAWWVINILLPREFAVETLHKSRRSNAQERLIYEAAINQHLLQITLSNGKVYVGWIDYLPLDSRTEDSFLQILPLMSGFRDPVTKKVSLPTKYTVFIERDDFETEDYVKILPRAQIELVSRFREDVYEEFQLADAPDVVPVPDDIGGVIGEGQTAQPPKEPSVPERESEDGGGERA